MHYFSIRTSSSYLTSRHWRASQLSLPFLSENHVVWPEITASLSYLVSQTIWFKQTNRQSHSFCVTNFSLLPPFPGLQEFVVYILPVLLV